MRYLIVPVVLAFSFIFSSCKNDSENNIHAYEFAHEGFNRSNALINSQSHILYVTLKEQLQKNETKVQASEWQPKAELIKRLTDSIIEFIQTIKYVLRSEAGENVLTKNKDWMEKTSITKHVFESNGMGKELYEKLVNYRKAIIAIDKKLEMKFGADMQLFSEGFDYKTSNASSFAKKYFEKTPVIGALMMLGRFENNVRLLENQSVTFFSNQIGYVDGDAMITKYGFLIGQSSNYLKVGDELEINAGMGSYTIENKPTITINGKLVPLSDYGGATYKFKTPKKPGKYFVPVRIEYTSKHDGKREFFTKKIDYTVVE